MIKLTKDGELWIVTIDRPDKANSLTSDMLGELTEIAERAEEAKVLVITGKGKVFSAGADLDEARAGLAVNPIWERLSGAIATLPGLTIAALNGTLAGGAFGMALACDVRIAAPHANFFYPVMRLGFLPQPSDARRMAALCGPSRAKMVLMGGARLNADEALAYGLIDRVVPSKDLLPTARILATDALGASYEHIAEIKQLFR